MILPKGKYFIADPCYVLKSNEYHRVLEETNHFGDDGGVFTDSVTGDRFSVFITRWGDGLYSDQYNFHYGVDAGCIACIPVSMADSSSIERNPYINIVDFNYDFIVSSFNGMLRFGHIEIDTNMDADSDDKD